MIREQHHAEAGKSAVHARSSALKLRGAERANCNRTEAAAHQFPTRRAIDSVSLGENVY